MLENALFESGGRSQSRKPATVLVSTAIHALIVLVLVLVPLFQPQAVPLLARAMGIPLSEIPKPPTPPEAPVPVQPMVQTVVQVDPGDFVAPQVIPHDIAMIVEEPVARTIPTYAGSGINVVSILRNAVTESESVPLPPPPPPAPAPVVTAPIRVGGFVQQANLLHQVRPDYPALAKTARVQGTVVLEAVIGKDGTVGDVRVVTGHPLLVEAAKTAVQQWRYKPTLLNNEPVEVITTITVTFTLQ